MQLHYMAPATWLGEIHPPPRARLGGHGKGARSPGRGLEQDLRVLPPHWQGSEKMPGQCRTPGHSGQAPGVFTRAAMNSPLEKLRCPPPTQSPREAEPKKRDARQPHSTTRGHSSAPSPATQPGQGPAAPPALPQEPLPLAPQFPTPKGQQPQREAAPAPALSTARAEPAIQRLRAGEAQRPGKTNQALNMDFPTRSQMSHCRKDKSVCLL